jgi:hypothetical protein
MALAMPRQLVIPSDMELPGSIHSDSLPSIPEPLLSRLLDQMSSFVPPAGSVLLHPVGDIASEDSGRERSLSARDRRPYTVVEEWPLYVRAACLEVSVGP